MTEPLRREFKFVIDGIELSQEQEQQLSRAVQEAGMRAVASWDLNVDLINISKIIGWRGGMVGPIDIAQRLVSESTKS